MNSVSQSTTRLILALVAITGFACLSFNTSAQQTRAREIIFPTTLQWDKQKGVTRYRLQIAGDDKFQNIFLDRPFTGERYVVSELSAGYYYWRVAADSRAGSYSKPTRFFVSGGVVTTVKLSVPPALAGGAARSPRRF